MGPPGERDALVQKLRESWQRFEAAVAHLTPGQWTAKPCADRWSAGEIAEHLLLTESGVRLLLRRQLLRGGPQAAPAGSEIRDTMLRPALLDRSVRLDAPDALQPAGRWESKQELIDDFRSKRDDIIAAAVSAPDLRSGRAVHPAFGELDAYQWLLFLAGHTERHTLQIEEAVRSLP